GDPELLPRQDGGVVRHSVEAHDALDHEAGIAVRIDVGGYLPEGLAGVDHNGLTGGRWSTAFPSAGEGSGAHGHPEKDERDGGDEGDHDGAAAAGQTNRSPVIVG